MPTKLEEMQAKFRERLVLEKEEKMIRIYHQNQKKVLERVTCKSNLQSNPQETHKKMSKPLLPTRKNGSGVDRSRPLKPIQQGKSQNKTQPGEGHTNAVATSATTTQDIPDMATRTTTMTIRTTVSSSTSTRPKAVVKAPLAKASSTSAAAATTVRAVPSFPNGTKTSTTFGSKPAVNGTRSSTAPVSKPAVNGTRSSTAPVSKPSVNGTRSSTAPVSKPSVNGTRPSTAPVSKPSVNGTRSSTAPVSKPSVNGTRSSTAPVSSKPALNGKLSFVNGKVIQTKSAPARSANPVPLAPSLVIKKMPSSCPPVARPPTTDPNLAQCHICGRNFDKERLAKHTEICRKTTSKKSKVFDSTKMRVKGTEAEQFVRRGGHKKSPPTKGKKADWRAQHENFISSIRQAKAVQQHLAKGGKLSDLPPPKPSENPDYVQCPHCQRKFNETVAERHIPKCKNIVSNKKKLPAKK